MNITQLKDIIKSIYLTCQRQELFDIFIKGEKITIDELMKKNERLKIKFLKISIDDKNYVCISSNCDPYSEETSLLFYLQGLLTESSQNTSFHSTKNDFDRYINHPSFKSVILQKLKTKKIKNKIKEF